MVFLSVIYRSFNLPLWPYLPWRLFWRCARPCFHGNQNWFQVIHSLSSSPSSSSFLEGRWGHLLKNTASQPIMSERGKTACLFRRKYLDTFESTIRSHSIKGSFILHKKLIYCNEAILLLPFEANKCQCSPPNC